ncbi:MAG: hypothetical protein NVS9B12_01330 [Vulcanimicrobiaceae bacterium]
MPLHDPALQSLLKKVDASVAWQPGERYVLLTTAEPRIVSFTVGEVRYDTGDVSAVAAFAPYEKNGEVYLPLYALARALYLEPKDDRGQMVLQPQIATAELQSQSDVAQLVFHAALPLSPKKIVSNASRIVYDFPGLGSTLERSRKIHAGGISEINVVMSGTTRNPDTKITLVLLAGAKIGEGAGGNYHDFTVALAGGALHAGPRPPPASMARATPTPQPAPEEVEQSAVPGAPATPAAGALAALTAVEAVERDSAFNVTVALTGNGSYEWHRLLDNRWYVDLHGVTLQAPPGDTAETVPSVTSLRVHQLTPDTVRVALTLTGEKPVDITPTERGLVIVVHDEDGAIAARTGAGQIGSAAAAYSAPAPSSSPGGWKYAPGSESPAASNSRLIVLDPGHGGSDPGAVRSEIVEKVVALDISKRLREILIARGWQVTMTHDTDRDVYAPNDGGREELQARCDVANTAGARLFVSVHANTAGSSSVSGTTFYVSKAMDLPLARALERRVVSESGTTDDGVQKAKMYVTLHTTMPAVLIETAFMTNPGDYQRLSSLEWRQRMAQAIADGIGDYAGPPGSARAATQRR